MQNKKNKKNKLEQKKFYCIHNKETYDTTEYIFRITKNNKFLVQSQCPLCSFSHVRFISTDFYKKYNEIPVKKSDVDKNKDNDNDVEKNKENELDIKTTNKVKLQNNDLLNKNDIIKKKNF